MDYSGEKRDDGNGGVSNECTKGNELRIDTNVTNILIYESRNDGYNVIEKTKDEGKGWILDYSGMTRDDKGWIPFPRSESRTGSKGMTKLSLWQ